MKKSSRVGVTLSKSQYEKLTSIAEYFKWSRSKTVNVILSVILNEKNVWTFFNNLVPDAFDELPDFLEGKYSTLSYPWDDDYEPSLNDLPFFEEPTDDSLV